MSAETDAEEEVVFVLKDDAADHVQKHDEGPEEPLDHAAEYPNDCIKLNLRYFNIAPHPLNKHLISLCPTTDILALAVSPRSVELVRIDGQHISTAARPASSATVIALEWTSDGRTLLITWSDNLIQATLPARKGHIVDATSIATKSDEHAIVNCVACAEIVVDPSQVRFNGIEIKQQSSTIPLTSTGRASTVQEWDRLEDIDLEELIRGEISLSDSDLLNAISNLPRKLALLNFASELPRLSIPPDVEDPDLHVTATSLGTQEGVDMMINRKGETPSSKNTVDVFFATWSSGYISIHTNFANLKLQDFRYANPRDDDSFPLVSNVASHRFSSFHALLLRSGASRHPDLSLSLISLGGIRQSSPFVNLLIDLEVSLNWVVDYIIRTVLGLREFWRSGQDLPSRFMANVNETLEEKECPLDLITALYELAMTGICVEPVKEWLIDELAERGYKRWLQASLPGYAKIQQATHENFLPALERASVIVCRLRVLARTPDIPMFDIDESILAQILNHLDVMRLIGHHLLVHCSKEMTQLSIFMDWLHYQIQILGADPDSQIGQEAAVKAASLDHSQLLAYITGGLAKSHLNLFLGRKTKFIVESARPASSQCSSRKTILALLERHRSEPTQPTQHVVELTNLLYQAIYLRDSCTSMHESVRANFSQTRPMMEPVKLTTEETRAETTDLRMVYEVFNGQECFATYTLSVLANESHVIRVQRLQLPEPSDFPPDQGYIFQTSTITLPPKHEIKQTSFFDDDFFLALVSDEHHTRLLHIPYSTRLAVHATPPAWNLFSQREGPQQGRGGAVRSSGKSRSAANDKVTNAFSISFHTDPHTTTTLTTTLTTTAAITSSNTGIVSGAKLPEQTTELQCWCHHSSTGEFMPLSFECSGTPETRTVVVLDKDGTRFRAGKLSSATGIAAAAATTD